jgi:predicted nucleic acid-binding protein
LTQVAVVDASVIVTALIRGEYVALAEVFDAPLITLDRHLAKTAGDAARVAVLTVG